jgi:hypothetical protein
VVVLRFHGRIGAAPAHLISARRHDGSSARSTSAAPDALLEVEHLRLRAEPEPKEELRHEQRHMMASAIDP